MKDTPILYSVPMVAAILDNEKTQTRRVINPPPIDMKPLGQRGELVPYKYGKEIPDMPGTRLQEPIKCPYGGVGDRLWVRETHYRWGKWVKNGLLSSGRQAWKFKVNTRTQPGNAGVLFVNEVDEHDEIPKKRTQTGWHKRPGIFMPRLASRISLEITRVRAEFLQSISEHDARAEGMNKYIMSGWDELAKDFFEFKEFAKFDPVRKYRLGWDHLNGKRGTHEKPCGFAWENNPPVWVIEFKRLEGS